MQFAITLLGILAVYCMVASFVTQGKSLAWYAETYSERTAGLILALGLDDAFHSPFFVAVSAFLCLNLMLCNLVRVPSLVKRFRTAEDTRMKFGMWGAWLCHLGVLLLILGFGLGQATKKQYTVYGVAGTTRDVGNTGCALTIDSFDVSLREDDTVEQYTAELTMRNLATGQSASGTASVNNPASLLGFKCYQNSTGWAADVHVQKDGEPLQDEVIYAGEAISVKDKPALEIWLSAFYPDYVLDPVKGPVSASSSLNKPAYLYMVYFEDQMIGMNALMADEKLTIDEYTVTFDNPRNYSLIQVKEDHFQMLALAGGLVLMLGLVLAFYVKPHPEAAE